MAKQFQAFGFDTQLTTITVRFEGLHSLIEQEREMIIMEVISNAFLLSIGLTTFLQITKIAVLHFLELTMKRIDIEGDTTD